MEKQLYILSETGFNKNMIPRYGFSIKNQKCYVPSLPKSKNYSVICAITNESILDRRLDKERGFCLLYFEINQFLCTYKKKS